MNTRKTKRSEVVTWCSKAERGEARPEATSFPGSLFSASLGRWKKDRASVTTHARILVAKKNMLGGRGGRVFCLLW